MEILRKWRDERELTVEEAGRLAGISGPHWSRYETGARRIPAERAFALAEITGIPREQLRPDIFVPKPKEAAE